MSRSRLLVLPLEFAAIAVGLGAEEVRFAWDEPVLWLPDLLVGWAIAACGLIAIWRRPSGAGPLLVGAGMAWFGGNFGALVARRLVVAERTVQAHTTQIFQKLQLEANPTHIGG